MHSNPPKDNTATAFDTTEADTANKTSPNKTIPTTLVDQNHRPADIQRINKETAETVRHFVTMDAPAGLNVFNKEKISDNKALVRGNL